MYKNAGIQTTLEPIDFHFIEPKHCRHFEGEQMMTIFSLLDEALLFNLKLHVLYKEMESSPYFPKKKLKIELPSPEIGNPSCSV